jgi:glycosyltransferase involved in cell wall biosynthesis
MSFCIDDDLLIDNQTPAPVLRNVSRTIGRPRDSQGTRSGLSVLFVTPFLPSPPTFGAQRRLHELISGVAASNDTSVLSLVDPSEDQEKGIAATEEYCRRVVTVSNPAYHTGHGRKRLQQLASLGSPHSYEWRGHSEGPFGAALEQMLAHRYDVIHFELAPMAGYAAACSLGHRTRPILCLDEHNIEYDIVRRTAGVEAGTLRRAYSAIEWRKVRREERHAWSHLDGCTVTSVRDQELLLSDEPTAHTAVVPNGVDLEFFRPSRQPQQPAAQDPQTLLFFGAIDYYPNTDAMLFFLHDALPQLAARYPGLRLCIVGRRPPESILSHRSATVDVTGVVDDVRPWIERADVVIVPLRIGGGTRLKILEAMAMGKAVVSTTLGAEGLDVVPERDLLIADDAEGLVAQVGRLLDDPSLGRRIGASARHLVASRYSWKAAVSRLSTFYGELLEARAATA